MLRSRLCVCPLGRADPATDGNGNDGRLQTVPEHFRERLYYPVVEDSLPN